MAGGSEREGRRQTFDRVAELYDRARPDYPDSVVDDLLGRAGLSAGSRVVEIGCGTGQATRALARRGLDVTCVELGANLAALAARKLARYLSVRVVNADFERWKPPPAAAGYDGVLAFSSFHWLEPSVRYRRPAELLRPGGALGVVVIHSVLPADGDPFFIEVQDDYRAVGLAGDRIDSRPGGTVRRGLAAVLHVARRRADAAGEVSVTPTS